MELTWEPEKLHMRQTLEQQEKGPKPDSFPPFLYLAAARPLNQSLNP